MKNSSKVFAFLIILFIFVSACGRNRDEINDEEYYGETGDTILGGVTVPALPEYDEVITVAALASTANERWFRNAANDLIANNAAEGRNVNVEFIFIRATTWDEWDEQIRRILSMFAAGEGPDVIMLERSRDLFPFMQHGFLADINNFIDRSLFYETVLDSFEINGQLYMIPREIGFHYVGINSKLPQSFLDRFMALDRASVMDIAEIYTDLILKYPEFAEFYIVHNLMYHFNIIYRDIRFSVHMDYILHELDNHIDFHARTVNLGEMYDFIINIAHVFENNRVIDMPWMNTAYIFHPTHSIRHMKI